jgi:hypothetical protein
MWRTRKGQTRPHQTVKRVFQYLFKYNTYFNEIFFEMMFSIELSFISTI